MRASRGMGAVREEKRPIGFASGGAGNWIKGAVRKGRTMPATPKKPKSVPFNPFK